MADYGLLNIGTKICFYLLVLLLISSTTLSTNVLRKNGTAPIVAHRISDVPLNIVKRHLRWNQNGLIVSDQGQNLNLRIDYLQPHRRNVKVLDNQDYMAFTLYMRNGRAQVQNTGIFHFIDTATAEDKAKECRRVTRHAGAYYHFYNECPEDGTNIVASGYCYRGSNGRGLVYNSATFNNVSMEYLDGHYYLNNNRTAHTYEQGLIKRCFESWKNAGFPVTSWSCPTAGVRVPKSLKSDSSNARFRRAPGECNDCECTPVSGSPRFLQWNCSLIFLMYWLF